MKTYSQLSPRSLNEAAGRYDMLDDAVAKNIITYLARTVPTVPAGAFRAMDGRTGEPQVVPIPSPIADPMLNMFAQKASFEFEIINTTDSGYIMVKSALLIRTWQADLTRLGGRAFQFDLKGNFKKMM